MPDPVDAVVDALGDAFSLLPCHARVTIVFSFQVDGCQKAIAMASDGRDNGLVRLRLNDSLRGECGRCDGPFDPGAGMWFNRPRSTRPAGSCRRAGGHAAESSRGRSEAGRDDLSTCSSRPSCRTAE